MYFCIRMGKGQNAALAAGEASWIITSGSPPNTWGAIDGVKEFPVGCDITGIQIGTRRRPGTPGPDVRSVAVGSVGGGIIVAMVCRPEPGGE